MKMAVAILRLLRSSRAFKVGCLLGARQLWRFACTWTRMGVVMLIPWP